MLILEYIFPRMGPPSGALRECQPGRPRVPYRRMSNSVHHAQTCIGSTAYAWPEGPTPAG